MKRPDRLFEKYMLMALQKARENFRPDQMDGGPFGACIVRRNKVLAVARNTVLRQDATCHAEMNAIRLASRALRSFDLSGCVIYSTTEPCPMCFSAIHWARIGTIVYGTRIRDVQRLGFHELTISNAVMKKRGKSDIILIPDFMPDACRQLLAAWDRLPGKKPY